MHSAWNQPGVDPGSLGWEPASPGWEPACLPASPGWGGSRRLARILFPPHRSLTCALSWWRWWWWRWWWWRWWPSHDGGDDDCMIALGGGRWWLAGVFLLSLAATSRSTTPPQITVASKDRSIKSGGSDHPPISRASIWTLKCFATHFTRMFYWHWLHCAMAKCSRPN